MKLISLFILLGLLSTNLVQAKDETKTRQPNQADPFIGQVQFCEGTEALGNEGQGFGAGAFINIYADNNTQPATKKCDLVTAFAYEYGNDRGLRIGRFQSYSLTAVSTGKTDCTINEENGQVIITVKKAVSPNSKSKRPPKVLIENCKMTKDGV